MLSVNQLKLGLSQTGKALLIMVTLAAAAALGLKVLGATGQHWPALLVAWLTLAAPGVFLVVLCAVAFRRVQVHDAET